MPTIEVSPTTHDRLTRQANARQTTVDAFVAPTLEAIAAEGEATVSSPPTLSTDEFRRLLQSMATDLPGVPSLPDDLSRADMYDDHD